MRKIMMLGTAAFLIFGGFAATTGAQAAPLAADRLTAATQSLSLTQEAKSRKVYRRYPRRTVNRRYRAYPYAYGRSIDVIPRRSYRRPGSAYPNGGMGDGGFIRGQQTQGITH